MNRIIYTAFIIAVIMLNAISCTKDKSADNSTQSYLTRNEWGPDIGHLGLYFEFSPNNTFKTASNFEGGAYYSGTYEFKDDKLKMKIIDPGEWPELKGKELTYRLKQDNAGIFFEEALELENADSYKDIDLKKLWNQRKIVANDQKRVYQNIPVQTINKSATINDGANFYQEPNENSKRIMFSIHDDRKGKLSEWSYVVPAEVLQAASGGVQLIARTIEKNDKNRYWFCILLPVGSGRYDMIKIEGSDKPWAGPDVGWIKDTDIKKIEVK